MRRRNAQGLASLAAILPAPMLLLTTHLHAGLLGLSADVWKGGVTGVCIGLQIVLIACAVRTASASCGPHLGGLFRRRGEKDAADLDGR